MSNRLKLLREGRNRRQHTVAIQLDGEVREQIEAVEDELDRLASGMEADKRLNTKSNTTRIAELEADLASLQSSAEDSTLYVVLQGMQATPYRALLAAHRPRKLEDGKVDPMDAIGFNTETMPPLLVKACIVGYRERPDADAEILPFPPEDVDRLIESATEGQLDKLAAACIRLTAGDDAVPLRRRRSPTSRPAAG